MSQIPSSVLQQVGGARRPRRSGGRLAGGVGGHVAALVAGVVVGGGLLGTLWWLLAPLARAQVTPGGQVFLTGHQELQAAQDGWFVVVTGLAGVVVATVAALLHGRRQVAGAVLAALAVGLAGVLAWKTGGWLGPPPLLEQLRGGSARPLTPLELSTPSALLVGPLLCCLTRFLAALFTADPAPHGPAR